MEVRSIETAKSRGVFLLAKNTETMMMLTTLPISDVLTMNPESELDRLNRLSSVVRMPVGYDPRKAWVNENTIYSTMNVQTCANGPRIAGRKRPQPHPVLTALSPLQPTGGGSSELLHCTCDGGWSEFSMVEFIRKKWNLQVGI